jgi:hypothetical protein
LVKQYDGKRPAALDIFMRYLGMNESEFMELVAPHVVAPHEMPDLEQVQANRMNREPWDLDKWSRITGDRLVDG